MVITGVNFGFGFLALLPLYLVANAILFGIMTAWLAQEKGRAPLTWLLVGALFGVAALIAVGLAPARNEARPPA
jgi:hypothetical protein